MQSISGVCQSITSGASQAVSATGRFLANTATKAKNVALTIIHAISKYGKLACNHLIKFGRHAINLTVAAGKYGYVNLGKAVSFSAGKALTLAKFAKTKVFGASSALISLCGRTYGLAKDFMLAHPEGFIGGGIVGAIGVMLLFLVRSRNIEPLRT